MQRRVLLLAGVAVVAVVAVIVVRGVSRRQAGLVVDQSIERLLATLPPGTAIKHGPTDYNPLTGTATIHDVTVQLASGTVWTARIATLSGAHGDPLHDVFDTTAYAAGHPAWTDPRLLVGDMSASDVRMVPPAGGGSSSLAARSLTVHHLSGRPFALPPTPENRARPSFQADAALAFAAGDVRLTDIVLTETDKSPGTLTIASMDASDYDGGKLGGLEIKTMALDGGQPGKPPIHATLASFAVKGLDARTTLKALQQSDHPDRTAMAGVTYDTFDMDGLDVHTPQGPRISMADFHAQQGTPSSDGGRAGHGVLRALTVAQGDMLLSPNVAADVAAFGMNAVTTDITVDTQTSPGRHTAVTEDLMFHELGTLHVKAAFVGTTIPSGGNPMIAFLSTTLGKASLVWDDASLTDRIFKVAATETHSTPALVRAQLAMPVVALGLMVPDQPDVADQVTAFLDHPHTLTVTMNPPVSVTLADVVRAPAPTRSQLLGVHVAGN